jgi:predicted KAP-like P-loop ATPase
MEMLTDNPILWEEEDKFGFSEYAHTLAETIIDTRHLPFCIGIFGDWGTGKSSLMNMIKGKIDNYPGIKTVWFNPWKYDKKEELWNALIQTILYHIAEKVKNEDIKNKAKEIAKSTAWFILKKGISALTSGIVSEDSIEKIKNTIAKEDEIHYRHINHFEKGFEEVVDCFTDNGKLVVFIDDLDRCLPENAITVLESLKLFIGNAKCVFVIGMDHYIAEAGIKKRYGEEINMSGRDYLDKIIQIPFFLPPVPFKNLQKALSVYKTVEYDDKMWRLIELGLDGNPRKTKRFVNCFYLLRKIYQNPVNQENYLFIESDSQGISLDEQNFYLAKLLIFQMSYPDFYKYLKTSPNAWEVFEREIIGASEVRERENIFEKFPVLEDFWKDEYFKSFMAQSARNNKNNFYEAPSANIVLSLMKAISLIDIPDRKPK